MGLASIEKLSLQAIQLQSVKVLALTGSAGERKIKMVPLRKSKIEQVQKAKEERRPIDLVNFALDFGYWRAAPTRSVLQVSVVVIGLTSRPDHPSFSLDEIGILLLGWVNATHPK